MSVCKTEISIPKKTRHFCIYVVPNIISVSLIMTYNVETCRFIKHLKDLVASTICYVTISDSDQVSSNGRRLVNNEMELLLKEGILSQFKELFRHKMAKILS